MQRPGNLKTNHTSDVIGGDRNGAKGGSLYPSATTPSGSGSKSYDTHKVNMSKKSK